MNKVFAVILPLLILGLWGCGNERSSPVVTENMGPVEQEMPAEVEKILDQYTYGGDKSNAMVYPLPYNVISGEGDSEWDVYAVTFLWGQFPGIPTDVAIQTDWTGSLSVNGIADIKVIRAVDFEDEEDWLVEENEPALLEWVSKTSGDFDGLCLLVLIKRGVDYFAPLFLRFDTEPFELNIYVASLVMYKAFYQVDDNNAVAVCAHKIWQNHCPHGLMEGKWIKEDNSGSKGRFEGLWLENSRVEPVGYFNGQFWTDENGDRILAGSVSGYYTDQVIASLKGRWYYDDYRLCPTPDCGTGHGKFFGVFQFQDRDGWGYFGGEFGWPTDVEAISLPLRGLWKAHCPTISSADSWN